MLLDLEFIFEQIIFHHASGLRKFFEFHFYFHYAPGLEKNFEVNFCHYTPGLRNFLKYFFNYAPTCTPPCLWTQKMFFEFEFFSLCSYGTMAQDLEFFSQTTILHLWLRTWNFLQKNFPLWLRT